MIDLPDDRFVLALHTSSQQLGLCLTNFAGIQRYRTWDVERSLSTVLHVYLKEFIRPQTWQDLAIIAADRGPGSFTSTRFGLVTARTLAQQFDLPLFSVSTLAAFARSRSLGLKFPQWLAVQMAATRGKLYGAIYRNADPHSLLHPHFSDTLQSPFDWQNTLDELTDPYLLLEAGSDLGETAPAIAELAYVQWQQGDRPHWSQALPFYG